MMLSTPDPLFVRARTGGSGHETSYIEGMGKVKSHNSGMFQSSRVQVLDSFLLGNNTFVHLEKSAMMFKAKDAAQSQTFKLGPSYIHWYSIAQMPECQTQHSSCHCTSTAVYMCT